MKTVLLIFILIISIISFADNIFSWTAPDGQLYMVSSKEKLDEIKKKYSLHKMEQKSIKNVDEKYTLEINEKVQALDEKKIIHDKGISRNNSVYVIVSFISVIIGILLGMFYNIRLLNKKKNSLNNNIKILAIIDRNIL